MTAYFCDGLKEVSIVNGVARLEFHRVEPGERGLGREARTVHEFTIALPVQGFAQALSMLDKVREQLIREGVLTAASGDSEALPPRDRSPNFA
jgi:hypothetical protein